MSWMILMARGGFNLGRRLCHLVLASVVQMFQFLQSVWRGGLCLSIIWFIPIVLNKTVLLMAFLFKGFYLTRACTKTLCLEKLYYYYFKYCHLNICNVNNTEQAVSRNLNLPRWKKNILWTLCKFCSEFGYYAPARTLKLSHTCRKITNVGS
jgi:hypothetical protein